MAIVKVRLEAVRYIAAKARYEDNEACKKIMQLVTYKRRSVGFTNLLVEPYYKDGNSPRALNIIADMLDAKVGAKWYKVAVSDKGIDYIAGVLQNQPTSLGIESFVDCTLEDKDILIFFNQQEMLLVNKSN